MQGQRTSLKDSMSAKLAPLHKRTDKLKSEMSSIESCQASARHGVEENIAKQNKATAELQEAAKQTKVQLRVMEAGMRWLGLLPPDIPPWPLGEQSWVTKDCIACFNVMGKGACLLGVPCTFNMHGIVNAISLLNIVLPAQVQYMKCSLTLIAGCVTDAMAKDARLG